MTTPSQSEFRGSTATQWRRVRPYAEVGAFVGTWMLLGYLLDLDANAYLLVGVPLTIAFQLGARRRPVRALWVRDARPFRLDARGWALAGLLAVAPAWHVAHAVAAGSWVTAGWWSCGVTGSLAAAFALRSSPLLDVLRSALPAVVIGTVGTIAVYGIAHVVSGRGVDLWVLVGTTAKYIAFYLPVTFVLEEVTFRGCLDAHVDRGRTTAGASAVFVSALWGLWHLPVAHGLPWPLQVLSVVVWQILIGIPLSRAWRKTGNLAGPALAHSTIDAVRNALLVGL